MPNVPPITWTVNGTQLALKVCPGTVGTDGRCCLCGRYVTTTDGPHLRAVFTPAAPTTTAATRCHADGCTLTATHGPAGTPVACWSHAGDWPACTPTTTTEPKP